MSDLVYQRKNGKWEARYKKGKTKAGKTRYGTVFGNTREEAIARRNALLGIDENNPMSSSELNILILGAGSYGHEVKETLEQIRIFNDIAFLDDYIKGDDIKGKCEDVAHYKVGYGCAFVAIADSEIRRKYADILIENKFYIPTIISPEAIVSPKAKIGIGTMIFAQGNVSAAEVGNFCLVQANGTVNAEAKLGDYSRLDNGAIVLKGEQVPEDTWLKPGKIYGEV